jgi:hypothetical protein
MIVQPTKDKGGLTGRATRNESAARSDADEFAVTDDDDAEGFDPILGGFFLGRGCSASAGDDSAAKIGLGHDGFHPGYGLLDF